MENTKENRIKFLRKYKQRLLEPVDMKGLIEGFELLNKIFSNSKNKQIVIKDRLLELKLELSSELKSELELEELELEFKSEFDLDLRWNLWSEVRSELGLESELNLGSYECYDIIWTIFVAEFCPKLEIIQENKEEIDALRKIADAGNAYFWISSTKIYVLPFPEIKINEKNQLHSETGPACKILDKESYWLYGVKFEKDLWEKAVKRNLSFKEIMEIKNIEQRMVALKMMDAERLLEESGAKLLDKSEKGNELYVVEGLFSQPAYFLKYKCPSTDRVYISGIDPEVAKQNPNADYCGQKTTELVRVEKTDKGEKVYWANTTKVCENPNCPLFVKVAKIKNWKRI